MNGREAGIAIIASEALEKSPKPVLTGEFASRVNVLASKMDDEQPIAPLVVKWRPYVGVYVSDEYEPPPQEWDDFMESLEPGELKELSGVLDRSIRKGKARTIGDLRRLSSVRGIVSGLGETRGKPFAYLAFRKKE